MASNVFAQPHAEIGVELIRDWEPVRQPKATIVLVHGIGEHTGRYERTGALLAERGFWVRGFDLIGAGGSGGKRGDIDDWSRYHQQIGLHIGWARGHGRPVVLMGHSLGGLLALGYALTDSEPPDLLVLSAPWLAGGAKRWQRAIAPVLAKLAPTLSVPQAIKGEALCRDPAVVEAYFADPLVHTNATVRFGVQALAEIDRVNAGLAELTIPTLVVHGGDDVLVPTHASEALERVPGVERQVYQGLRHEIMNEPEGPEVVSDIAEWLTRKL